MTDAETRYMQALEHVAECVKRWFPVSVPRPADITIGEADGFRIAYAEMERCAARVREERKPKRRSTQVVYLSDHGTRTVSLNGETALEVDAILRRFGAIE